ncbi:MAG TPA: AarF/ABC1/UbiB kinase family protein [Acidimicrobiales bacterium]|nr:AarF/ABC1/UbiB kinase family protein [Acidimicrobiales bacterium]
MSRIGRVTRAAEVARVGAAVGAGQAATSARKVFASAERRHELDRAQELRTAEQVVASLGNMKGALMKLGQMASYIDTSMPEPIREALASLQQDAPPMSAELSAGVIATELGGPPDTVFAEWDPVPIAAASIGQVHRALTRDGRAVAVKVQYPGVADAIAADLANSDMLFGVMGMIFPGLDPGPIVQELRERLTEELDYSLEARNQQRFADYYRGHPFIHVPDVLAELSSPRVLTTELATGARFSEVTAWAQDERDLAGEAIFRYVFRSLYRFHVFNGDPHPGNYLFSPGGRVTFLDYGLVKQFTPDEVRLFEDLAMTIAVRPDPAAYRKLVEDAGILLPGAPLTDREVSEWFGYFYEQVLRDEVTAFDEAYASKMVDTYLNSRAQNPAIAKNANVPASLVIIQRINLGLVAVLAQLHATGNFRRIAEELWPMTDRPPSTELGRQEAEWLAAKAVASRA